MFFLCYFYSGQGFWILSIYGTKMLKLIMMKKLMNTKKIIHKGILKAFLMIFIFQNIFRIIQLNSRSACTCNDFFS